MDKSRLTRDAFLDTALQEASLIGIARLTLAPIAAAAGRSKGGLLRHFPSKESLQIAVLERAFMRYQQFVFEPAMKAPSGLPRLRLILENWLNWTERAGLTGGCPILSAQQEFDDQDSEVREHLRSAWLHWSDYLKRQAVKARDAKQTPADLTPDELVMAMIGLVGAEQLERRLLGQAGAGAKALHLFDCLTNLNRR